MGPLTCCLAGVCSTFSELCFPPCRDVLIAPMLWFVLLCPVMLRSQQPVCCRALRSSRQLHWHLQHHVRRCGLQLQLCSRVLLEQHHRALCRWVRFACANCCRSVNPCMCASHILSRCQLIHDSLPTVCECSARVDVPEVMNCVYALVLVKHLLGA